MNRHALAAHPQQNYLNASSRCASGASFLTVSPHRKFLSRLRSELLRLSSTKYDDCTNAISDYFTPRFTMHRPFMLFRPIRPIRAVPMTTT